MATYTFEVFNQGDVVAQNVVVHDRLPEGLKVDASVNSTWSVIEDRIMAFEIPGQIEAGQSYSFTLQATVDEDFLGQTFVNTAEIVYAENDKGDLGRDFDSRADERDDNDAGGEVEGATDNMIDDNGDADEDDHDPAILRSDEPAMLMHDVALSKSTQTKFLMGDTVVFELTVHNEGQYTFGEVKVIDYLPFFLFAADEDWEPHAFGHVGTLSTQNGLLPAQGLLPGESATIEFSTVIDQAAFPGYILNSAEVGYVADINGVDISDLDKDSQADFDPRNDVSDNPKEQQGGAGPGSRPVEDDRAAFEFLIYMVDVLSECECLNNDVGNTDGGFGETVVVTSASDETWYVDIARDIFQDQAYSPFVTGPSGFQLTEFNLGGGLSEYSLTGYFPEGSSYYLVVKNVEEEAAVDISGGQDCKYERPGIDGQVNVCIGSETEYEVINANPGGVYEWFVDPAGGSIVGSTSGDKIRVQWDNTRGGPYTIWVNEVSPDNCVGPSEIEVTIGDEFIYSVSCISELNVTIGPDCETRVVPEMLLVGGPYDYSSFNVMLTDKHGNAISGATLTYEHVGTQVMAKVINSCTGNSCWATLNVEDKTAPEIMCFSDTIRCISIGQYAYPRAIDGCDPSPVVTLVDEIVEPLDCNPLFIKRVTRMFVAEDQYGNISDTCTQVIMLERIVLGEIDYPDSMTVANGMALECNMFEADSLGLPTTNVTGIPTYRGLPIYPQEYYCNVGVNYHDIELPSTGCVRKFIREWRVFEWWCTTEVELIRYPQYIEIRDNIAPEVVCPDVHYVKANTRTCDADVFIDMPIATDTCSDIIRIDLVYPGGIIEDYTPRELTFPLDTSEVKIRAYDECYNVDSCSFLVIVEDDQPPVPVCDQFTTVGLTDTGLAYIYAETFDDGSYDNCDLKLMEVKRMDDGAACGFAGGQFGPFVEFCCEDVGRNVMVMLRVTDKAGNTNTCMVEVEVQDKIPPIIYCPPADTIDCDFHYDTSDLSMFGEPIVHDNCDYTLTEMVFEHVDQCREGYIERVWIAQDSNNMVTCSQRIYIINSTPFDSSNITWPEDFDTTECINALLTPDLLPERFAFPRVDEDFCDLVGITYTDQTFDFSNSNEACYKILRTWKIINWCRFDSSQFGQWTHEQVIKVNDDVAPIITSSCAPLEMPIFDNCDTGYINLVATGTDSCTEDIVLRWEYHIDYFNDGITDVSDSGFGSMIDASRFVPLGDHNVRWVFEDRCGNRTVCTQNFDVFNAKPPTAYCKNGLIVDLIPMDLDGDGECDNEMVEVWAVDLDDNSTSACGDSLIYSFGMDTSNTSIVFNCDSFGRREVVLCVTDTRGYQSCCTTFVVVQDNNMVNCCPKRIDKDCVVGPPDIDLLDCDAATDPDDLMSMPVTSSCEVDSIVTTFMDEDATTGENCEKIKRTWTVTLYLDGNDTTCVYEQCITIDNEFTLDSIIWPDSTIFLVGCDPSLDTSNTGGVPRIRGEYCDYVTVDWADEQVERPDTVCTYFERTWTITNACDNDKEFEFVQLIVFRNQTPPELTPPGDVTVSNDPGECDADVMLPPVTFTDCSSGVTIINNWNNGGADASGNYPVGKTIITFTATDTCGNMATASTCVTVEDNEPPMLICPDDATFDCDVNIDSLDFGTIATFDNCGEITIEEDTVFNLNICNIGTIIRTITVRDTSGNDTSCVQTLTIENSDPFDTTNIVWPPDTVVISACASIDPDSTGRPMIDTQGIACVRLDVDFVDTMYMDTCNGEPCNIIERKWVVTDSCQMDTVQTGEFCFVQIIEIRGAVLMLTCPPDTTIFCEDGIGDLSQYGDVMVMSECGLDTIIRDSTSDLNVCDVGTITRTFIARDSVGNEMMCSQVITIDIRDPFTEGRITWPMDTVVFSACDSFDISEAGEPVLDTTGLSCFDIEVFVSDTMYNDTCNSDPCTIIERTWTVVDSCQIIGGGGGTFSRMQVIIVEGGMLSVTCPPDTTVACTTDLSDLSVFGVFEFNSPCGIDTVIRDSMIMLNECDLGMIFRSILVRDTLGNEVMCEQKITVVDENPFTEANITWPQGTLMLDGCGSLDPDSLMSRPVIDTSAASCYDISVSFSDSSSSSCMQTPCLVVTRTWEVVDSCVLDTMGNGRYTFTQTIEVNDTVAPVFNVTGIDTTIILDADSCDFFVGNLAVTATDCADSITITNNSPFADMGGADASGMYPVGVTNFFFFAEDPCCNIDSIPARVELVDTVAPTINCTKVIKQLTDSIAGVKFFANEGVVVAFDNCTDSMDLRFSFSLTDPADTCRFYDCDSVRSRGTPAPIWTWKIYAFDEAGNVDSCDIFHQVVDLVGCLLGTSTATVSGIIQTNRYSAVSEAQVHLEGGGLPDKMTDQYGIYQFEPMPIGGRYLVEPGKNDDPLNGVTTKDLILIQRHLLGIKPFDNPYDLIAADINKSDEITAGDIIMLRRLLLGYYTAFPRNTSWRFVDEGYSFPDPLDPWLEVFPETYEIDPLEQHMNVNFVGVKIGDVSGDVGLNGSIGTRESERFLIEKEERGGLIHFYKSEGLAFDGVQFTMEWTPGAEEFELVYDQGSIMDDMHFGFHSVNDGILTVVLDEELSEERTYLFSLPQDVVQGELRITSRVTQSMAITQDLESVDVAWFNSAVSEEAPSFTLYQNRPNPFKEGTVIGFDLPEDQEARLTILNVSGQIVHIVEGEYERGYNEVEIRTEDLLESGVYYYRLDCAGSSQTLKMINID